MTSKTVPKLSYFDRAGVIYFRVVVPKELRQVLKKDKFVESTQTSDKRQAERFAALRYVEILEDFEVARRRVNPQPVTSVTPELGKVLAGRIKARKLSLDDHTRQNHTTVGALVAALAHQQQHGRLLTANITGGPIASPLPSDLLPGPDHPAFMGATPKQAQTVQSFHSATLGLYREALARHNLMAALHPRSPPRVQSD